MKKGLILFTIAAVICIVGCKKSSNPQYCYKLYEFFVKYPVTGTPSDSFPYIDTSTVLCDKVYYGDTTNKGTVTTWTLNGQYYYKGTTFEVYQH